MHTAPKGGSPIGAFGDLPPKIQEALRQASVLPQDVVVVLKSALKPDATTPIIWAVVTKGNFLLCSTLSRRGIWRTFKPEEMNDVRREGSILEIIPRDADAAIFPLRFPPQTPTSEIDEIVQAVGVLLRAP